MERRYGRADRIWVSDRGMMSADNIAFLKQGGRRYIIGTPKSMLRHSSGNFWRRTGTRSATGWKVKLCPVHDGDETFVLCRSRDRREKEKAMHDRFEQRIEEGLQRIASSCHRQRLEPLVVAQRVAGCWAKTAARRDCFHTEVKTSPTAARPCNGQDRAMARLGGLSEGCYLLRSNVTRLERRRPMEGLHSIDRGGGGLPRHKSDLRLRPIWHQKEDRVLAHILVCFLAYVLWKTLAQRCQCAGLGHEPRRVFDELGKIQLVDVVMPTRQGTEIRRRCVTQPSDHQAILLTHLKLDPPRPPLTDGL